jgi:hypothetical protein
MTVVAALQTSHETRVRVGKRKSATRKKHDERIDCRGGFHRRFVRFGRGARCAKGKGSIQHLPSLPRDRSRRAKQNRPWVNGIDGRKAGMVANFDYSDANKNSGILWNEDTFEEYIKNPAAKIPETKMIFPGIKNEQQVKDLWAYISQFDASGSIKK